MCEVGLHAESKEINFPSKCKVTDTADDCLQNSLEEPMSKPTQIWDRYNFLSHIVFTNEAKFKIAVHVSWHDCISWGSETLGERSEHERDSPKGNVLCVLLYEESLAHFCLMRTSLKQFVPTHVGKLWSSTAQQKQPSYSSAGHCT